MVAGSVEGGDEFVEERLMVADGQALHVLEYEGARVQLGDDPHELKDEIVAGVFQGAVSDQREALTRRPAEHTVYPAIADAGRLTDIGRRERGNRLRDNRCIGEVELMNGAVDRIDLNGSSNVEAGLLEA